MPLNLYSNGLTDKEVERFRLLLSVFQDGTGWETKRINKQQIEAGVTLPGWRQFERLIADVFGGLALERKGIFDVLLPLKNAEDYYGISCKMKAELDKAQKPGGRVYIELSNAAGEFTDKVIQAVGHDFRNKPADVGHALIELIETWHHDAQNTFGYKVSLAESSFLVLLYNSMPEYRLFQYSLGLPTPGELTWEFRQSSKRKEVSDEGLSVAQSSRCLVGYDASGAKILEWYFQSGGQLKYYPLTSQARWTSERFMLQPLPEDTRLGVISRVEAYFPSLWTQAQDNMSR